jgi:hypothetical protein
MNTAALRELVDHYATDPEAIYTTWSLGGEARMKAFGAIRMVRLALPRKENSHLPPARPAPTGSSARWPGTGKPPWSAH